MKKFFITTFACVLGVFIAGLLLTLLSVAALTGMVATTETEYTAKPNTILKLDLGVVSDRSQEDYMGLLLGTQQKTDGLDNILKAIETAKQNKNIAGIYIDANGMAMGMATLDRIHRALDDFKESGKFVYAYADNYSQREYLLSAAADSVILNPVGAIDFRGLAGQVTFMKGLYDKLGIEMQVLKVGTYKSAVEPFTSTEMSDANREQINAYLASIWKEVVGEVGESRNLTSGQLNTLADKMLAFYPAEESVSSKLIDSLAYKNDMRDYLKRMVGVDEDDDLNVLGLSDMAGVKRNVPKDKSGNIIAVYYAYGEIDGATSMTGGEEGINSEKVIKDLRKLQEDEDVKAVVLRVNSPGGSAYGSEQIWYAVSQLKKEKPVIVSMGDYAASGGYYISCCADTIVAEPTTLTGSIGIFGMAFNAAKLVDKIGLDFDVVKTNQYADFGATPRGMNEGEMALLQMNVERGYDLFLTRCSDGRGIAKDEMDKIAQGRVWTGATAKELGLVDVLGGLDTAIEIAVEKAGVDAYTLVSKPNKQSFLESLLSCSPGSYVKASLLEGELGDVYKQLHILQGMDGQNRIQARMPFEPNIK